MFQQDSLFDVGQTPTIGDLGAVRRIELGSGAWVDTLPNWVHGSAALFDDLVHTVPWRAERREMYERVVDVPRLVSFFDEGDALPSPVLTAVRLSLNAHYAPELGEPFVTAGLCLYRNGADSVAWHGDRIGRGKSEDTMVAILSLGDSRALRLRPVNGGDSFNFPVGHGDLLVMGGSCQRTWEHCVPKTAKIVGPRISVQFRPLNVR